MLKKLLTVLTMMLFSFVFSQQTGMATYYNDKYVGKKQQIIVFLVKML